MSKDADPTAREPRDRIEISLAALLILCAITSLGVASHRTFVSPAGRVIFQDLRAPWISVATPVDLGLRQYGKTEAPVANFTRTFDLEVKPERALLQLRAFGEARVSLNGSPLELTATSNWRRFRELGVGSKLRAGTNRLHVAVRNLRGPALLSARLEYSGHALATDATWLASEDTDEPTPAILATDQRPVPDVALGERPAEMLARHGLAIAGCGLAAAVGFLALRRRLTPKQLHELPRYVLVSISLAWIALFAVKLSQLMPGYGFDVTAHREYIDWIRTHARIPDAGDGWSTYHPPLFYLLQLSVSQALTWIGIAPQLANHVLPFATGVGNIGVCFALTRVLLPECRAAWIYAALFGGFLPANLILGAYESNEGLHALLAGAGLVTTAKLLLSDSRAGGSDARGLALASGLFGLALLTKFTAVLVAGPCVVALAARLVFDMRSRSSSHSSSHSSPHSDRHTSAARSWAALLAPLLVLAGPLYLRNLVRHGEFFVGNWSFNEPGRIWWSPPGFHTPEYYLSFGGVFEHPYLSGVVSFWDALYSTFWGDGLISGQTYVSFRHSLWNYEFMSAGYWLAAPATVVLLLGAWRCGRAALTHRKRTRRITSGLLLTIVGAFGFAIFFATLGLPFYGQARALYATAALPIAAYFFASEVARLDAWLERGDRTALRALLIAAIACLFGTFYLSFIG